MSDRPVRDTWDEARIDGVLRRAVAVEPSPALRARVRARISAEPAPSSASWFWLAMAAGAAGTFIAFATIAGRGWIAPVAAPPAVAAQPASPSPLPYAAAIQPEAATEWSARAPDPAPARAGRSVAPAAASAGLPGQPQFSPGDRTAFALLLSFSRSGRPLPLESLPPVSRDLDVVVPAIDLSAIDIPALVVAGVNEGVSQ